MRARPQVAMAIIDPDNPYRYLEIRGHVAEVTENGADEHKNGVRSVDEKIPYATGVVDRGVDSLLRLGIDLLAAARAADRTRRVDREARGEVRDLFAHALFDGGVSDMLENVRDPVTNFQHFGFAKAASGHGGTAEANASALHGRQRIERNGIFVNGDTGAVESFFRVGAGDAARMDFHGKQVIVGAASDDAEAAG